VKRFVYGLLSVVMMAGNVMFPAAALAADPKPLVLETSPLPISLSTDPGKTVTADIRVKQSGTDTAKLKVSLMKFGAYGEEGKPELKDRGPGDDYFDWVKFDKTVFDAPPNVWQTIKMTVNVPKTAAFGYYYAAVFSRVGDDAHPDSKNTNAVSGATAVLVLLEAKNPNAKRTLELASFTSKHRVYEFLPTHFDVKLSNVGNVHAVPQGDVFILKGKKQVASLSLNGHAGNILPGSKRVYPVEWTDGFPVYQTVVEDGKVKLDKNNNQVRKLMWSTNDGRFDPSRMRFGKYTAHLFAVYDDGQRDVPIEADLTFWVIPWRFILVIVIIMVLIGLGVYAMVRGAVGGARRLGRRR
jgi:hypothetical protein